MVGLESGRFGIRLLLVYEANWLALDQSHSQPNLPHRIALLGYIREKRALCDKNLIAHLTPLVSYLCPQNAVFPQNSVVGCLWDVIYCRRSCNGFQDYTFSEDYSRVYLQDEIRTSLMGE